MPVESFYYFIQVEDGYTKEELLEAYKSEVESVYGTVYELDTQYIGDLEFEHYSFAAGTLLDGYYSEVYVFSNGETTIYAESLVLDGEAALIEDIVATMSIEE